MEEKIREILAEVLPGTDLDSKTLADDGIIDSMSVVNIVTELAVEFDIEISFEDLINENFNSVEAICALVERLQSEG